MILLLMVAAVTVADDPILVLGPELAKQLHVSADWSGWFIAALGAGTVLGSFRRSKHRPTLRLAATALAALALFMLHVQPIAPKMWIAVMAALGAGASCLIANSVTRAVLAERAGPERAPPSWRCGRSPGRAANQSRHCSTVTLGSWIGPQWTGLILATPALVPITVIVLASHGSRPSRGSHSVAFAEVVIARLSRHRAGPQNLWPLAPLLAFSRPTSHHPSKRMDDNIARDRHNQGMADPTPTRS